MSPSPLLLERESELAHLTGALDAAALGGGAFAAVLGDPGEGKTALLQACVRGAVEKGFMVSHARGSELERRFGFGAARQLLEPRLRALSDAVREDVMSGAAGFASVLVGDPTAGRAEDGFFAELHGLYWTVVNLADRRPLLLALDDAHWSDVETLHWLAYLVRRLEGLKVFLLVAARTTDAGQHGSPLAALLDAGGAAILRVRSLSPESVGLLAARRLQAPLDDASLRELHRVTAGNPFAVDELLNELDRTRPPTGSLTAKPLSRMAPERFRRGILSRLARLDAGAVAAAHALAVLDDGASAVQVTRLARLGVENAAKAVDELVRERLVDDGEALAFAHPIIRTAIYDEISQRQRAILHRHAAAVLERSGAHLETIAAHLLLADAAGRTRTVTQLRGAASSALARGASAAAVSYLERAVAEPPPPEMLATVLGELGSAALVARSPSAVEHLRVALACRQERAERTPLRLSLADALLFAARWEEGTAELELARAEVHARDRDQLLRIEARLPLLTMLDGRLAASLGDATVQLAALRELAGEPLDGARPLRLTLALLLAIRIAPAADVRALIEAGLDGGAFLRLEGSATAEAASAVIALVALGDLDRALELTHAMIDEATRRGSLLGFLAGSTYRGLVYLRRGALADAEADIAAALELEREHELVYALPHTASYLALVMLERGRADAAWELLTATPLIQALAATPAAVVLLEARGRIQRTRGRLDEAEADLRACGEVCAAIGIEHPGVSRWRSELARTLRSRAAEEARQLASEEVELARRSGSDAAVGVALQALAEVGEPALREATLRDSVEALERSPLRLEFARSLTALGAELRRNGRRVEARGPLRRALELASACGAGPLAELARDELLASGARPRRVWLSGVEALTPSELRVARMVAQGLTNKDIAQTLFITTQTVKGHLSSVYRKLEITSRRELMGIVGSGS